VDHRGGCGGIGRLTSATLIAMQKCTNAGMHIGALVHWCIRALRPVAAAAVLTALFPATGRAQIFESIGIRAQGMSGAFVAVSDDATTTWWNPAGLAGGGYFNSVIEFDRVDHPSQTRARAFALNVPSLGLSYYRLALNGMRLLDTTESPSANREDQGVLSQFGVTVGQSVGAHLILGSTLKLMHALGETSGDLDMGAMATFSRFRLGLRPGTSEPRSSRTATRCSNCLGRFGWVPPSEAVRQAARRFWVPLMRT
jgi:hypothetical protein